MKYFTESELRPARRPGRTGRTPVALLGGDELDDVRSLAEEFSRGGEAAVSRTRLDRKPHMRMFIAFLCALGALRVEESGGSYQLRPSGRLARHVPQLLHIYLSESLTLIDSWNVARVIPEESMSALELLTQFELRRIDLTRRAGRDVRPLAERPVAFAVFHAVNDKGDDCYLFEINQDWGRLNFIGGKQEAADGGDFLTTVTREIVEELGLAAQRLSLSRLNDEPLTAYGLSGNAGSLAHYPCVLYGVRVDGPLRVRMQDRWLTERQIRDFRELRDGPLMVNPVYLDFLLAGSPSRLSRTPVSTADKVRTWRDHEIIPDTERPVKRWVRVLRENKDLLAAVLTLLGAVIAFMSVF
ncbi:hypothetical protein [Streptomyces sp. UNOC14_S4]|uniref:hypothetical protein n=1 Tax=Streptomyces sp. UNOC14_S4 TaxID=2872340 RepID=UPI001E57A113|nr:hypothetical protein [Streptomyces sp. UNOC14_S4]MCC3771745.1 hypothetical protein [Streptomyces sp. UNOC14_S4]